MRRTCALTFVFAVTAGMFTYACSDDTEALRSDGPSEGGRDGGNTNGDRPTVEDASLHDGGDAGTDADSGDASDDAATDDAATDDAGPAHKIVVLRVGELDGGSISPGAGQLFLDEYELGGNTLVRSIRLPTQVNGDQRAIVQTAAPSQVREGAISSSTDGRSVVVTGYTGHSDDATPPYSSAPSDNPRVVARITADGSVDTSTLISDSFAANYVGGAAISGNDIWIGGNANNNPGDGPLQYLRFGNSVAGGATNGTEVVAPYYAHNCVRIFEDQLYASTNEWRIVSIGTGLPTTGPQVETPVVTDPIGASEFEFVDLDGKPGAERLYVAVDGMGVNAGVPGGVRKYVYDSKSKTWTYSTTFRESLNSGLRGLAAYKEGDDVIIVATTTDGDKLVRFVDPATGTPMSTVIATAPHGAMYRGVTHAPKP
ncbi:hypothetical protein [Labilithrix luteola]|uniref:hypothetical protein n=1 Tax=Labilithrix luteola TaxID=1391654 RepID=UPI0014730DA5|nr:hypothetical protein [Labilithrix luteola]